MRISFIGESPYQADDAAIIDGSDGLCRQEARLAVEREEADQKLLVRGFSLIAAADARILVPKDGPGIFTNAKVQTIAEGRIDCFV